MPGNKYILIILLICSQTVPGLAQKSLDDYLQQAYSNSPLLQENAIRQQANTLEAQRIGASLTRPVIGTEINYLLSPIITTGSSGSSFKINPDKNIPDYYGYDLAITNGGLYRAVVTLDQPILNGNRAKTVAAQYDLENKIIDNNTRLTRHDLQKTVTAQYIFCLRHIHQLHYFNELIHIIALQRDAVQKLAASGLLKQADAKLLDIELMQQQANRTAEKANYHAALLDLNILCGIGDTVDVQLADTTFELNHTIPDGSAFTVQYQLDSLHLAASQQVFNLAYKPQLSLYSSAGLNTVYAPNIPNRFGIAAGIRFTQTIFDGRQRQLNDKRTQLLEKSAALYSTFFSVQNETRKDRIRQQIQALDTQANTLQQQAAAYDELLNYYRQQLAAGQLSVIDYITVLRSRMMLEGNLITLQTNKQLLINEYNYWNW